MYNRYIPRPDGSYQRSRMPDRSDTTPPLPRRTTHERPQKKLDPIPEPDKAADCPSTDIHDKQKIRQAAPQQSKHSPPKSSTTASAESFLRQLLPKDCDTGDLLIIVLLLLMAGDCDDDKNTALLTLALYLFM